MKNSESYTNFLIMDATVANSLFTTEKFGPTNHLSWTWKWENVKLSIIPELSLKAFIKAMYQALHM